MLKFAFIWLYLIPALVCLACATYEVARLRISRHRVTDSEIKATLFVILFPLLNLLMALSLAGYAAEKIALQLHKVPVLGDWLRRAEVFRD